MERGLKRWHAVDTIHGIRTDADRWPHVLATWMAARTGGRVDVNAIEWGFILGVQMYLFRLVPLWARGKKRLVAEALRATQAMNRPHSIVAHSFGTWLAVETLLENPEIEIECLVFADAEDNPT